MSTERYYPTINEDTPFAKKFNEKSSQYWVDTGRANDFDSLLFEVLIDDYNHRHEESSLNSYEEIN